MFFEDFANFVEILVEKILLLVMLHPMGHQRAATAHDAGNALAHKRHVLAHHSGVNGHVIHALFGLLFDDFEHQAESQIFRAPHAGNRLVDGNRANRNRRSVNDGPANFGNVPAGREVHHRVRAVVDGVVEFFQLLFDVGAGGGIADVGVDFAFAGDANGHRLEVRMMDVRGNNHASTGDFAADQFRLEFFAFGDVVHFLRDGALPREMHLRHVASVGRLRAIAVC